MGKCPQSVAICCVAAASLLLLGGTRSTAQEADDVIQLYRWFADRCPAYLEEVSDEFGRLLPASERSVFQGITVECANDAGFGAASDLDSSGTRRIRVTWGTLMALEPVATVAAAASSGGGHPLCTGFYIDHYGRVLRHNMRTLTNGGRRRPLMSPYEFLQTEEECPGITQREMMSDPELDGLREFTMNAGLKFILAHEFAHHLFADVPRSDPAMERRCDKYAIEFLTRTGVSPFAAGLPVSLLGTLDDFSMRSDPGATHPAGGCRFLILADALRQFLEDDLEFSREYDKERPGMRSIFLQAIEAMEQAAEEEGGC